MDSGGGGGGHIPITLYMEWYVHGHTGIYHKDIDKVNEDIHLGGKECE